MKILLNNDKSIVNSVRQGLKSTGGYCPYMRVKCEETKCMCEDFRSKVADPDFEGYCNCLMYYKQN